MILNYRHVASAGKEAVNYIIGRKDGSINPLKTSHKKLNDEIDFEWGRIVTLAGISGSGKSTILEQWKRDFCELNKTEEFDILSFEFEMLAKDNLIRSISGRLKMQIKDILSKFTPLSDDKLEEVKKASKDLSKYPMYVVDTVGTVEDIGDTIFDFIEKNKLKEKNRGLIVTIDHILLTKGKQTEVEKVVVDNLMHKLVEWKKFADANGIKLMFICLSQLNRNIETPERVTNSMLHYPTKNDIFGASSVYYSSDIVIVTHKPAIIEGLGRFYGPPREGFPHGLPVIKPDEENAMLYWHLIKSRFGDTKILMMVEDFKYSRVLEY